MKKRELKVIRGNTRILAIALRDSRTKEQIPFENGDVVSLIVKKFYKGQENIIEKRVSFFQDGVAYIEINPEDTENLPLGRYRYSIFVEFSDGSKKTIVPMSWFIVTMEAQYG